jgi:hypothetical protein
MNEFYFNNSIIKPPTDTIKDQKTINIVIDSRLRDKTIYENPNKYSIDLYTDLNNVTSARMIYIDVPFSAYMINTNCDSFYINDVLIALDHGNYTESEFVDMIQTKLNAAVGIPSITLSYSSIQDKFAFEGSTSFTVRFANHLMEIMGFKTNMNNSVSNKVVAPFRKNFAGDNYIILHIEQFDVLKNAENILNGAFALVPKTMTLMSYVSTNFQCIKTFNPPIARLARLSVSLFDKYGNPYDFQNQDHRFEIIFNVFHSLRQPNQTVFTQ